MKEIVIIIGAGAAGLAAARTLTRHKIPVVILEARNRIGGRIMSEIDRRFPIPIELGPEFIHGQPAETFGILAAANVKPVEVSNERYSIADGQVIEIDQSAVWSAMEKFTSESSFSDCSFSEFVAENSFSPDVVTAATNYVEGFNAADASRISVRSLVLAEGAADALNGDRQFRLSSPYSVIADTLLGQCDAQYIQLMLNAQVASIGWKKSTVECALADGQKLTANAAIVTLPLPFLKQGLVKFDPPLKEKKYALDHLEMGQVQRIVFLFKERFWEGIQIGESSLTEVSFMHFKRPPFRTWWSCTPITAPLLVAWNAGRSYIENIEETKLVDLALAQLAKGLNLNKEVIDEQLLSYRFHDWEKDPFSKGAYSYCLADGWDAPRMLSEPLADTLYFAGEATNHEGNFGTVHGAIATGEKAAELCLKSIRSKTV